MHVKKGQKVTKPKGKVNLAEQGSRNNHTRPYKCQYCEKSFTDPSQFNAYEQIHTGVKPYKCKYCD